MNTDPVKLGRIGTKIEKALAVNFGDGIWVYISNAAVDRLAASVPSLYLERLNQASLIIKKPDYVAYDEEKKSLYLIREYLKGIDFVKVVLELASQGQFYYQGMYVLSAAKTKELSEKGGLCRLED
jgi:hypothetical protein